MVHPMITRSKKRKNHPCHPMMTRSKKAEQCSFKRRRFGKNSDKPVLPMEVMFEILSRLDVESLLRCKSVSKEWHDAIQEQYFVNKHMMNSSVSYVQLLDSGKWNRAKFEYTASRDGLLLERCDKKNMFRVRNPAIRQVFHLPEQKKAVSWSSLGFAPSTGNYKVVCVCEGGFEVFTLGIDSNDKSRWRFVEVANLSKLDGICNGVTPENGRLLHVVNQRQLESNEFEIISFDFDNERFYTNMFPLKKFLQGHEDFHFLLWEDKFLAISTIVEDELHSFTLRDHTKNKWYQERVIQLTFLKQNPEMKTEIHIEAMWPSSVWFWHKGASKYYDSHQKRIVNSVVPPRGQEVVYIGLCTLVTFKGMRPEEEQRRKHRAIH